jgi:hypothetical protein
MSDVLADPVDLADELLETWKNEVTTKAGLVTRGTLAWPTEDIAARRVVEVFPRGSGLITEDGFVPCSDVASIRQVRVA